MAENHDTQRPEESDFLGPLLAQGKITISRKKPKSAPQDLGSGSSRAGKGGLAIQSSCEQLGPDHPKPVPARTYKRSLKPRKHDGYDNSIHGFSNKDGEDEIHSGDTHPNSVIDSRKLMSTDTGWLPPVGTKSSAPMLKDAWHESVAYHIFAPTASRSGIWIPHWLLKACGNARQTRLESWLLWWFDDSSTTSGKRWSTPEHVGPPSTGLCRARYPNPNGERVLVTSYSQLGKEVNLDRSVVKRCLENAGSRFGYEIPSTGPQKGNLLVYPKHAGLINAWVDYGDGKHDNSEIYALDKRRMKWKSSASQFLPGWFESKARVAAMNRNRDQGDVTRGTYVFDIILAACGMRCGEAMLLSDILWWFGVNVASNGERRLRTRIKRDGYRWIARSSRHLERDWGIRRSSAQRWMTYLTEVKQYLVVEKAPFDLKKCRGQFTVHLRPNTPVLECAIYDAKEREDEIADARTHFMM